MMAEAQAERGVRDLVRLLAGAETTHLNRAVVASVLAKAADRLSRTEVMAARQEGVIWAEVAEAFGISTQAAHERFRSGPDGLHSRRSRLVSSIEE